MTQQRKGWYSWLYSLAGTIKTNQNSFFCDKSPPPPLPSLSILKLWFNFILGLNFIFFCFKLIIIHYHTQKPTYLGSNQPRLLILETLFLNPPTPQLLCPTVNSLSTLPNSSPQLSTAPMTPLPVGEINQVNKIPAFLCAAH